jgi:hypothetical protein
MINLNESDLRCPGIEPEPPDSLSKALPIDLTGRQQQQKIAGAV